MTFCACAVLPWSVNALTAFICCTVKEPSSLSRARIPFFGSSKALASFALAVGISVPIAVARSTLRAVACFNWSPPTERTSANALITSVATLRLTPGSNINSLRSCTMNVPSMLPRPVAENCAIKPLISRMRDSTVATIAANPANAAMATVIGLIIAIRPAVKALTAGTIPPNISFNCPPCCSNTVSGRCPPCRETTMSVICAGTPRIAALYCFTEMPAALKFCVLCLVDWFCLCCACASSRAARAAFDCDAARLACAAAKFAACVAPCPCVAASWACAVWRRTADAAWLFCAVASFAEAIAELFCACALAVILLTFNLPSEACSPVMLVFAVLASFAISLSLELIAGETLSSIFTTIFSVVIILNRECFYGLLITKLARNLVGPA